ncbi:hypothetical protein E3G59_005103 [Mycobacteroides abscessus]|uniref:hypothetical protein n=1 Tax=Mycobacteroides abscessus TaxID=36809 RepID=UPI001878A7AC|nr:hypothetical protein [Mycobacteroides abscessus]
MDRPARRPGPPVDAARLQPDNQGDIHRVDEGLVGAWLDDPDLAAELADELEQLERLRRLQADEELVLALQLEQFTGRLWARFSRELTRYGLGVLRAWIRHGTIYVKAKKLTGAEAMALLTTDRARQALFLQEHGFTQREIADKLGLRDAKSVENLLGHQLRQLRNRKRTS